MCLTPLKYIKNEDFCKIIYREQSFYKNHFVETSFSVYFV